ncbi:hypothetical protein V6Z11_A07G129800 [Gossypium hirsutum]
MSSKMKAFFAACILLLSTLVFFTTTTSARALVIQKKERNPIPKPKPGPRCSKVHGKRVCIGY